MPSSPNPFDAQTIIGNVNVSAKPRPPKVGEYTSVISSSYKDSDGAVVDTIAGRVTSIDPKTHAVTIIPDGEGYTRFKVNVAAHGNAVISSMDIQGGYSSSDHIKEGAPYTVPAAKADGNGYLLAAKETQRLHQAPQPTVKMAPSSSISQQMPALAQAPVTDRSNRAKLAELKASPVVAQPTHHVQTETAMAIAIKVGQSLEKKFPLLSQAAEAVEGFVAKELKNFATSEQGSPAQKKQLAKSKGIVIPPFNGMT